MVVVKREGVILEPTDLEFESQGVFNPACIKVGDTVHMFYRAVAKGNYSSIGYCRLDGPLEVAERAEKPILFPEYGYEKQGTEDPRIVSIEGTYYMTYMAYDGRDVWSAYATSKDLKNFGKKGRITHRISYAEATELFSQSNIPERYFCFDKYGKNKGETENDVLLWGKDTFLFPEKINGKFALIHRVLPEIQVIYFNDFSELTREFWMEHLKRLSDHIILDARYWFESRWIGGGCPPIETDEGWLFIYHAVEDSGEGNIYRAGTALLDKDNPCKTIGRLENPLFSPQEKWEKKGVVNNVVFPTGTAVFDGRLYIYHGTADTRIGVVSLDLEELLAELLK
ncbi:MAG: pesticidal protein Cry7Aa [Candidatus Altiarchaeota archaeon]|nr:pesticidal protein Cry7Aa [Candidatus Altiarchaeota archaeon]